MATTFVSSYILGLLKDAGIARFQIFDTYIVFITGKYLASKWTGKIASTDYLRMFRSSLSVVELDLDAVLRAQDEFSGWNDVFASLQAQG